MLRCTRIGSRTKQLVISGFFIITGLLNSSLVFYYLIKTLEIKPFYYNI